MPVYSLTFKPTQPGIWTSDLLARASLSNVLTMQRDNSNHYFRYLTLLRASSIQIFLEMLYFMPVLTSDWLIDS